MEDPYAADFTDVLDVRHIHRTTIETDVLDVRRTFEHQFTHSHECGFEPHTHHPTPTDFDSPKFARLITNPNEWTHRYGA